MNNEKIVIKSSIWYFIANLLVQGINYITMPIFTRILTHAEFGYYNNYIAWTQIIVIFATFLRASLISAKYDYKEKFDKYIFSAYTLNIVITLLLWIIIIVFKKSFSKLMSIDIMYINWMLLYVIFYSAFLFFQTRERLLKNYKSNTILSLQNAAFTGIWAVMFVMFFQDKLQGRIIGSIIPTILIGIYIIFTMAKQGKTVDHKFWKYGLKVSLPYIPHALSLVVLASIDKIMITKMCGIEETAIYSLAYSCTLIITILTTALNDAYVPWLGDKLEEKKYEEIRKFSKKYILIFMFLASGIMLIVPELLSILGGKSYHNAIYVVTPILLGAIYQFLYIMFVNIEQIKKRTVGMAVCSVISALVNIVLNYIFIPKYGYVASAYTTAIGYGLLLLMHMIMINRIGYGKVYDYKFIVLNIIISCMYAILTNYLYSNNIARLLAIVVYIGIAEFILMKYNKVIYQYIKRRIFNNSKKVIIIGAGGFAKSIIDSIDLYEYEVVGFLDENHNKGEKYLGINIIGHKLEDIEDKEKYYYFIAIGNNNDRKRWYNILKKKNLKLINIIDKTAVISKNTIIGEGCFFGKLSVINSDVTIGNNTIVNSKALIEHGCTIESHCNISTNSAINGEVKVGEGSFVGSSSVTLGQITIGNWSIIGAGSVVNRNVEENHTVVGNPAKAIKKEKI